ncbi:small hydrophilic protein [Streptomyces termitum]|uniref:Small hydrophilic protein n=1 Tax=Streptomyces termitum TaxID=67368 RepID=A0A918W7Z4_9ACTN|nr:small hydrophilic protein [Streptomyces termitum]GHA83467.1 hypothetical protein GCM10010305_29280 [Streptomyces termitum]
MPFTHRMAGLAAVVAVPLGIAATSYALTEEPKAPRVPPAVRLTVTPTPDPAPSSVPPSASPGSPSATPSGTPSDSVVPGPSATGDDDDDDHE